LGADGRLSPPDGLAKYAERLPGSAFEDRPIWKAARENAQPHHCGKQKASGIRWVDAGRYASIALAGDNASAEKCFPFAHALRHDRGDLRVMRGDLQRRIRQQATEAAFKRALNDFGQEGFNRLTWRQRLFHPRDTRAHIGVQIAIEAMREERSFVAEGVVDARLTKPHCIADISHGCSGESACPKALDRGFERNAFIELTGSGQFLSIQLASY
jgi:hypothetical protein